MPTTTRAGPSNHWLTLEPGYEQPQQAEDVPEVTQVEPDPEPKKRAQRVTRTTKG